MDSVQHRPIYNRIAAAMAHTMRYAFKGETRLAADAGVSKSAVCRLLSGKSHPSFILVVLLTRTLELRLNRKLDPRELISMDGTYPTPSVCKLVGCSGCSFNEEKRAQPESRKVRLGTSSGYQDKGQEVT